MNNGQRTTDDRLSTFPNLFSRPVLYCISDPVNGDPATLLRAADSCAVDFFQFRHKGLTEEERRRLAVSLARVRRRHTRLLVNETIDWVRAIGADGVHLPAGAVAVGAARTGLPGKLVGVSVHSLTEAAQGASDGADYLLLAPIFSPLSKSSGWAPLGLGGLRRVCAAVTAPVIALGGMTPERFGGVLDAGAAGIAGISLFSDCAGVEQAAASFRLVCGRD